MNALQISAAVICSEKKPKSLVTLAQQRDSLAYIYP